MPFENIAPLPGLEAYVQIVIDQLPEVDEIWLFGSRAEGLPDCRDWDLIAFSRDRLTAERAAAQTDLRNDEYCLFIANGAEFRRPWPRRKDNLYEGGRFSTWKWTPVGDGRAEYLASADKPNRSGGWKPAFRIWHRVLSFPHGAPTNPPRR